MKATGRARTMIIGGAIAAAAFAGGAALAVTASAAATTDSVTRGAGETTGKPDPSTSKRSDEHLLTGTTASKVRAAARAKYPNATIERVETDSDGVYEAHVVTSAGQHLIVQVGKDFAVTGTDTGGGPGGRHGDHDGDHGGDHDGPPPSGTGYGA